MSDLYFAGTGGRKAMDDVGRDGSKAMDDVYGDGGWVGGTLRAEGVEPAASVRASDGKSCGGDNEGVVTRPGLSLPRAWGRYGDAPRKESSLSEPVESSLDVSDVSASIASDASVSVGEYAAFGV